MAQASEERILEIIQKHTQDPAVAVSRDSRIEDTGIDSYGLIEIVFELEEALGIDIPYNANDGSFAGAETIGDLLDNLRALIGKA
jgi:acyl carrier protein